MPLRGVFSSRVIFVSLAVQPIAEFRISEKFPGPFLTVSRPLQNRGAISVTPSSGEQSVAYIWPQCTAAPCERRAAGGNPPSAIPCKHKDRVSTGAVRLASFRTIADIATSCCGDRMVCQFGPSHSSPVPEGRNQRSGRTRQGWAAARLSFMGT
jgi:hypothetical protein